MTVFTYVLVVSSLLLLLSGCRAFICKRFTFACFVPAVYCFAKSSGQISNVLEHCGLIFSLCRLLKASQGDIGNAVGLLTTQPAEVQDPGETQEPGPSAEAWDGQKGTLGEKKKKQV